LKNGDTFSEKPTILLSCACNPAAEGKRLEQTGFKGEYRFEHIAGAVQMLAARHRTPSLDDAIERLEVAAVNADRQTPLQQRAIGAPDHEIREPCHVRGFVTGHGAHRSRFVAGGSGNARAAGPAEINSDDFRKNTPVTVGPIRRIM